MAHVRCNECFKCERSPTWSTLVNVRVQPSFERRGRTVVDDAEPSTGAVGRIGRTIMLIPIQRLRASACAAYLERLVALNAEDRRLCCGVPHSSTPIAAYVGRINFDSDWLFGVHGEWLALDGVAHLALGLGFAELGLSVLPQARGEVTAWSISTTATDR